jgi:hypothetical protein
MRPRVRLVTYAWGKRYVDRLLDLALPAALAPGNLPALTKSFDCTAVIVTEQDLFDHVRSHPLARRVGTLCPLELVSLDDLVGEPWQYGLTVAQALFRGFQSLGPAMTDTYMLFLNADFVMADGSYERLIPHLDAGERVLLAPSYCVVEERVRPVLGARRDPETGILALPPREMADLIITHRHNTIRAKTVNQKHCHFQYMDQFYWQVDDHTLIGHQMPVALVAMKPEQAINELSTFWDWGVVYDFCPSRRLTVLGDSDDFLMLELRPESTHAELIKPGWDSPRDIASRLTGHITEYQVDNAKAHLTLHSQAHPPDLHEARAALCAFRDQVLSHLPSSPIDHHDHQQWIYHQRHFRNYRVEKAHRRAMERISSELVQLEEEFEQQCLQAHKQYQSSLERLRSDHIGTLRALRDEADLGHAAAGDVSGASSERLERSYESTRRQLQSAIDRAEHHVEVLTRLGAAAADAVDRLRGSGADRRPHSVFAAGVDAEVIDECAAAGRSSDRGITRRAYRWAFGAFPETRVWHPFHLSLRHMAHALKRAAVGQSCVLAVCDPNGTLARALPVAGARCVRVSPERLLGRTLFNVAPAIPGFDLCVMEIRHDELAQAPELLAAVLPAMRPGSTVIIHCANSGTVPRASWDESVAKALTVPAARVTVRYSGSRAGWWAIKLVTSALRRSGPRYYRAGAIACSLVASTPLAFIAAMIEQRSRPSASPPPICTSVTVEIGIDGE